MQLKRDHYLELPISKLGDKFNIAPNFELWEVQSKCGADIVRLHPYSPIMLQAIRTRLNAPITINSGYRTVEHNRNVRGASQSTHIYGMGFDLVSSNLNNLWTAIQEVRTLKLAYIGGVKRYNTFIHVDCWIERVW